MATRDNTPAQFLACALLAALASCSRQSAAIGIWDFDMAATIAFEKSNPASERVMRPRTDLLNYTVDVEPDGLFTVMREFDGAKSEVTGTWTDSEGKIKMVVDSEVAYTGTVDGRKLVLVDETFRVEEEDWVRTLILNKR